MIAERSVQSVVSTCKARSFLLAFFWCLSFSVGILFVQFNRDITVSLMCTAPLCRVSIFGLVVTLLFPLVITAVAVYFSIPFLIFALIILKGVSFGYCLFGSFLAFGSAGWLIFGLLTFSQTLMIIPLLWLWLSGLSTGSTKMFKHICGWLFVAVILCITDYLIISPFLALLML